MSQIQFVVFSDDENCTEALKKLVELSGHARVSACVSDEEKLVSVIEREHPQALLADLGRAPHVVLDQIAQIKPPLGNVIVCGPSQDSAVVLRALKLGVREFLTESPSGAEISGIVEQLVAERKSTATAPGQAATARASAAPSPPQRGRPPAAQ